MKAETRGVFALFPLFLTMTLLCLVSTRAHPTHAFAGKRSARPIPSRKIRVLAQKIKQIAQAMLDKHATVDSVAAPLGSWKLDEFLQCQVTPRDPEFREGRIDVDRDYNNPHTPKGKQPVESLDLTLAKGVELTPHALERVFGKWHTSPPPPEGNPYLVSFYYPNNKALFNVWITAELSGPPEELSTKITSLTFTQNDFTSN